MTSFPISNLIELEAYLNLHKRGGTEWRRAIEDAALKKDEKFVWLSEDDFQALVMRKKKDPVLGWKTPAQVLADIARRLAAGESPESIREASKGCGCSRAMKEEHARGIVFDVTNTVPVCYGGFRWFA